MKNIALLAVSIVQKLFDEGFIAYFAGGFVRDLLLDKVSDEIDIATSAPPEKIIEYFPKTVTVGISFGVVIVVLEGINFEVTTFRKDLEYFDGRHPSGVDYSTAEKDAERRDFTINGMFYNPLTHEILDYVGGQEDLKRKIIRAIGDPYARFQEDRLRMIRAVRFSSRLNFPIEENTKKAIIALAPTLFPSVSIERIWQELCKMSRYPHFDQALIELQNLKLLATIFPTLKTPINDQVAFFPYFPLNTPTIIYIIQLFPPSEREAICRYLKIPNHDIKLVSFFSAKQSHDKQSWAHFYANPHANLYLQVEGAKILPPDREQFHKEHEKRKKELAVHIKRIQEQKPLITATLLQQEGITPGKKMGTLLKEGEKIVIENDIEDPHVAIEILKQSPIWS